MSVYVQVNHIMLNVLSPFVKNSFHLFTSLAQPDSDVSIDLTVESGKISAENGLFTIENLEKPRKQFDWLINAAGWAWLGFIAKECIAAMYSASPHCKCSQKMHILLLYVYLRVYQ